MVFWYSGKSYSDQIVQSAPKSNKQPSAVLIVFCPEYGGSIN